MPKTADFPARAFPLVKEGTPLSDEKRGVLKLEK